MRIPIYISLTDKHGKEVAHTAGDVYIGGTSKDSHFDRTLTSDYFPELRRAKFISYYVIEAGHQFISKRELTELTRMKHLPGPHDHLEVTVGYSLLTRG